MKISIFNFPIICIGQNKIKDYAKKVFFFILLWYNISIMRIDKFLKVSRILKRRTVANQACESERVYINGKVVKPAHKVKVGDTVTVEFAGNKLNFIVKLLNEKASKEQAPTLYEIINQ